MEVVQFGGSRYVMYLDGKRVSGIINPGNIGSGGYGAFVRGYGRMNVDFIYAANNYDYGTRTPLYWDRVASSVDYITGGSRSELFEEIVSSNPREFHFEDFGPRVRGGEK